MAGPDDSLVHLLHTAWSGALTLLVAALGWFMRWNWNRLVTELDSKADKDALEAVEADMNRRHDETLGVLKEIRDTIASNNTEANQARTSMQCSRACRALSARWARSRAG